MAQTSGTNQTVDKVKLLKNKVSIARLNMIKVKLASTSQDMSSPDGPHYTLTKLKRKGYPVHGGTMYLASQDGKYAKYYLLDSQDTNGNGWGVTEGSIKQNIKTFIDMPFVVTAKEWIPDSPYEDQFDHPFIPSNDLRSIFAHQEKFRVGTITKVAKEDENGKWYAMIKINPKYAHLSLPPFCSPAIYQIDPHESDNHMTKWIGLHLAGLMSDPAYGPRVAILRGACSGNGTACAHQFKMAKDSGSNAIKPFPQQDQSGLDITETDKIDNPLGEKKKDVKIGSCACPDKVASLQKRLLPFMTLKQRVSKLKQHVAEFNEADHPRDGGKFTKKDGGSSSSSGDSSSENNDSEKKKMTQLQDILSLIDDDDIATEIKDSIQVLGEMSDLSNKDIDEFKDGISTDSSVEDLEEALDLITKVQDNSTKDRPDDDFPSEHGVHSKIKETIQKKLDTLKNKSPKPGTFGKGQAPSKGPSNLGNDLVKQQKAFETALSHFTGGNEMFKEFSRKEAVTMANRIKKQTGEFPEGFDKVQKKPDESEQATKMLIRINIENDLKDQSDKDLFRIINSRGFTKKESTKAVEMFREDSGKTAKMSGTIPPFPVPDNDIDEMEKIVDKERKKEAKELTRKVKLAMLETMENINE